MLCFLVELRNTLVYIESYSCGSSELFFKKDFSWLQFSFLQVFSCLKFLQMIQKGLQNWVFELQNY